MALRNYTATVVLATALVFIAPAGIVDAATVTTSTVTASIGDVNVSSSETRVSSDNIKFARALSLNYNRTISPAELIRLRNDFDFGFGDISLIYATAVYSGRPVEEISHHRYELMGWGEIAKLYGVKVKDLKKSHEDVVAVARDRGIEVNYIQIDDNQDDKNEHKKDHNSENKHDKDKGKGHGQKK